MSRRAIQVLGLTAVGGVGYYLYNAGGDPKLAQKQAEGKFHPLPLADASKASAKIKSEVPGRTKEAEKKAESLSQEARSQFDKASKEAKSALNDAEVKTRSALSDAEVKAREYKEKTGKELNQAIDKFDKTVEEKAAQAKSGISGWFGGSK